MSTSIIFPAGPAGPQGIQGPPGTATTVGGIYLMGSSGNLYPTLGTAWTQLATLTGAAVIKTPSTIILGTTFLVQLQQDAIGGRAVTWDSFYKGLSGFALDTSALTQACILFQINLGGTAAQVMQVAQNGWSLI